jgi:hypothetical protein
MPSWAHGQQVGGADGPSAVLFCVVSLLILGRKKEILDLEHTWHWALLLLPAQSFEQPVTNYDMLIIDTCLAEKWVTLGAHGIQKSEDIYTGIPPML